MAGVDGVVLTRRELLRNAGGVVALAAIARAGGRGPLDHGVPPARGAPSDLADFLPFVGTGFQVATGAMPSPRLTLVEATDLPARGHTATRVAGDAFSLVFDGVGAATLPAGTHTLVHPSLGRFDLFLGPVGRRQRYEAIVNRHSVAR